MQIIEGRTEFQIVGRSAVAIGKFDGVHKGHLALLRRILSKKQEGYQAVVFTFQPSAAAFFGGAEEKELSTIEEKRALFERMQVDVLVEFPLNSKTAAISPESFVKEILAGQMHAAYIAAGSDLSFGYRGKGDQELLQRLSYTFGYQVEIIEKVLYGNREISSSYVREETERGNMETAAALLGRAYSISGVVETGNRLGRKLLMPTVNLYPEKEKLLPPNGVYYSKALMEGAVYDGITNIGKKPTVSSQGRISVETYLYGFQGDLYGKKITVELLHFKRPECRFESVEALKKQMQADIEEGKKYHQHLINFNG